MKKNYKIRYALISIIILIIICVISLEVRHHLRHQKAIALSNNALTQYTALLNSTTPLSFEQLLPVMDNIHAAETALTDDSDLKIKLDAADDVTTKKLFLPLLANCYEQAIVKNLKKPIRLYPLLNSYLMLTQPKALDSNMLLTTARAFIPEAKKNNFKDYLFSAIQPPFQGLPERKAIVDIARKSFESLPLDQQAVVVLFNQNLHSTDMFKSLQWFVPSNLQTPVLYTKIGFNDVINNLLPIATNSVLYGNLALGLKQNTNIDPNDLSKLTYNLYLTQYTNYWASILTGLHIKSIGNLDNLKKMLSNFGSNQSELTAVMKSIHDNTDIPEINDLNTSLQALNKLFDTDSQTLAALQFKFANILNQLNNMSKTDRISWINQAIEIGNFNPINLDMPLPAPMDNWLTNVSQQYWQLNLNAVLSDINQAWQTQIYAFYQQHFFEHFPFAASEFPDADLENFTAFFTPNGILDTFIQQNLKNFINTKQLSWTFRQFPGFSENINESVTTLQKLHAITQMFFNNTVNPTLQFSLAPILMTPNIKQVSVSFNKIALTANQGSPNLDIPITWQLSQHDKITLNFLDDNNQIVSFSKTGTWAWLRILADNKVQAVDPTDYDIQFDSGILQAQYKLKTNNLSNPFELSVLSGLVVPKEIF